MRNLSMARLGMGVLGLLAPRMFTRVVFGRGSAGRETSVLVRAWAVREVALGMITMHEMESTEPSERVVQLNAVVDATDAVGALIGWPALPRRSRLATFVGGLGTAAVSLNFLRGSLRNSPRSAPTA